MHILLLLLGLPLFFSVIILFPKAQRVQKFIIRLATGSIIAVTLLGVLFYYRDGYVLYLADYPVIRYIMLGIMLFISLYITYAGIKSRSFLVSFFSGLQGVLFAWFELVSSHGVEIYANIYIDKLSLIMIMIVGLVGGLIFLYSGRHQEVKVQPAGFYSVMLLGISAMFGLTVSNDLTFMLLFLQIITLCTFLLVGYTKTPDAVKNSFTAVTVNTIGDLCFTVGILMLAISKNILELNRLTLLDTNSALVMSAVLLIACAGLIKAAQFPFIRWLLGTMEASTSASAILHCVIVNAGAYVIIRLTQMLGYNTVGISVTFVGALTFFIAAALAGSDAKKMLAFSTISCLGLIIACAGINTPASAWAAIMLIILHAAAKALIFLSFAEHQSCCSDAKQMECLHEMPMRLKVLLGIGMAGMLFAPFIMLVSKWTVMQAIIESGNILIVMIITFGTTVTLFFWAKWLGRLTAHAHHAVGKDTMGFSEKVSLFTLAGFVLVVSLMYPVVSRAIVVPFIRESMMVDYASTVSPGELSAIVLMLGMLLVVPVLLIPYFKRHWAKETSIYLSGVNAGDDLTYHGAMGQTHAYVLENRNMITLLDERKFLMIGCIICAVIIIGGFFFTMGGAII